MKYLIAFLLCSSFAFGTVRPLDRVHAYAGNHKVTVRLIRGVYWVEMEGSDIFGVGSTVDDAADDFMADVELEQNEMNRPHLQQHGQQEEPPSICAANECI